MAAADSTKTKEEEKLLKLYNEKILPVGISESNKSDEIVDIISDYPWSAQQFSQRATDAGKSSYTHNIPFCYAIERMQTVNSSIANIINSLLGSSKAMLAAGKAGLQNIMNSTSKAKQAAAQVSGGNSNGGTQGQTQGQGTATSGQTGTQATAATPTPKKEDDANKQKAESPAQGSGNSDTTALANFLSNKGSILDHISSLGDDLVNSITPRLAEGNLANSDFLYPWRWLYLTKVTGKKFVFPTFTSNQLFKITNSWGADPNTKVTDFFEDLLKWPSQGAEIAYAFKNFTDFLPQEGQAISYEGYNIEKALGFNYNTAGDEFPCQFVLFNTTKKDAWRKNHRFIVMFLLRNLPLRTTMYSVKPPLLYDIIVPGVKHLPLCYVSNITVDAVGHVRNMTADNFLKEIVSETKNTQTLVPVPEAWRINISFKCLIPSTMNLILNTTNFPINVTTVTR